MRFLEPPTCGFGEDRWSERPEDFTVLDALVQYLLHLATPRVRDDTPVAEGSRPPFRAALKPPKNFSIGYDRGRALHQIISSKFLDPATAHPQSLCLNRVPDLIACISRPPISMIHHERTRLSQNLMPHIIRSPDGQPPIACRWLNVNLLKSRRIENFPIRHTIEGHSTRETHRLQSCALAKLFQHAEIDFLKPQLQSRREVAVPLFEWFFGIALGAKPPFHRFRKQRAESRRLVRLRPAHLRTSAVMREIFQSQPE